MGSSFFLYIGFLRILFFVSFLFFFFFFFFAFNTGMRSLKEEIYCFIGLNKIHMYFLLLITQQRSNESFLFSLRLVKKITFEETLS